MLDASGFFEHSVDVARVALERLQAGTPGFWYSWERGNPAGCFLLEVLSNEALLWGEYQSGAINLKWSLFNCWTELTHDPNSVMHEILQERNFGLLRDQFFRYPLQTL
jgi:hypothetical protein